jgi:hypothetical protein
VARSRSNRAIVSANRVFKVHLLWI